MHARTHARKVDMIFLVKSCFTRSTEKDDRWTIPFLVTTIRKSTSHIVLNIAEVCRMLKCQLRTWSSTRGTWGVINRAESSVESLRWAPHLTAWWGSPPHQHTRAEPPLAVSSIHYLIIDKNNAWLCLTGKSDKVIINVFKTRRMFSWCLIKYSVNENCQASAAEYDFWQTKHRFYALGFTWWRTWK